MGSSYVYFLCVWCLFWLVDCPIPLIVFFSPKDAFVSPSHNRYFNLAGYSVLFYFHQLLVCLIL